MEAEEAEAVAERAMREGRRSAGTSGSPTSSRLKSCRPCNGRTVKCGGRLHRPMAPPASPEAPDPSKHLHVRLADRRASVHDLITEYLQSAGKAPDWFWRLAGRLEGSEAENFEELLASAFEAGAYVAHDHPEEIQFDWVTEEECERERRREESQGSSDSNRRERSSLSHYA